MKPLEFKLYAGRGWDFHYAEHGPPDEPQWSFVNLMFSPTGCCQPWRVATSRRSRLREWWRRRRGWTFYDGDGRRA